MEEKRAVNIKYKILHLEDVKSDADQINRILLKAGIQFESLLVDTRSEFVNALYNYQPDIIISDHSLPTFNSLEAMDEVQNSGFQIPFILVTGAVSEEFAAIAMKKGADDYVLKDRLQRLPNAITTALNTRQLKVEQKRIMQQLQNISKYSQDIICTLDNKGKFIFVSDSVKSLLGYDPTEIMGKSFTEFVVMDDIPATIEAGYAIVGGSPNTMLENRYIRKDGSIIPIVWSCRWEESQQTIFCIGKDATEQINSLKKLEESKRRFEHLIENLPVAVYTSDKDGKLLIYNNACIELWGRRPDLDVDRWCGSFKMKDLEGRPILLENSPIAHAIKKERNIYSEEIIIERPDGTKRSVVSHPRPQFDDKGNVSGAINVLIDITERKAIEDENEKLALVASLTSNAVVVTDADGKMTWVNKGFERITEYSFEEVKGKKPGEVLQGPETDQSTITLMRKSIKRKEQLRVEVLNYSKSGRKYWLDLEIMPLKDKNNNLIGFISIQQDITDRKKSERETKVLIDRLKSINRDLKQFSYIVSHNLRAPIARILGLSNLYDLNSDSSEFLTKKITEEVLSLDNVVKDINQIITAHDSDLEIRSEVNLEKKLKLVLKSLDECIIKSKAVITFDFTAVPKVFTIRAYVYSILYNLISNAIKFRSPNRVPQIHIKSFQDDSCIYLVVEDNGLGIDLQVNGGNIFGLYKRFHDVSYPGKGIGLNLVRAQAESMDGGVTVSSMIDKGSTFTVFLNKKSNLLI